MYDFNRRNLLNKFFSQSIWTVRSIYINGVKNICSLKLSRRLLGATDNIFKILKRKEVFFPDLQRCPTYPISIKEAN